MIAERDNKFNAMNEFSRESSYCVKTGIPWTRKYHAVKAVKDAYFGSSSLV
jgi:hypothetical protein